MSHAGLVASALMLIVMAGCVTWRLERSRLAALDAAARMLDLRAGELARKLDANFATKPQGDPQATLNETLAHETQEPGVALLADPQGAVRAAWPPAALRPASLVEALGNDALLPFFADKAGALRIEGPGGDAVYAALRNLGSGRGQVALIARPGELLAAWREEARVLTVLMAATALILGGCAGFFWLDAERARDKGKLAAQRRASLDSGCRYRRSCRRGSGSTSSKIIVPTPPLAEAII